MARTSTKDWSKLTEYLRNTNKDRVILSFDKIEELIGEPLVKSARDYPAFWANGTGNQYSRFWHEAGYETNDASDSQSKNQMVFIRAVKYSNQSHTKSADSDSNSYSKELINKSNMLEKRNMIVFGAPGTGKSWYLNTLVKQFFNNNSFERVTFYPDYSYYQFIGSYKPFMHGNDIQYEFVPGPFIRILKRALEDENTNYALVIEEINRANAAAVFGDTFQLLDRNKAGDSEYSINPTKDLSDWFLKNSSSDIRVGMKLPKNMYIWATMNSADQGVFTLDTAFKRRWDFKYIGIDDSESSIQEVEIGFKDATYKWNDIRKAINNKLIEKNINEDKQLGPFFVKGDDDSNLVSIDQFKSKVLMYLFEDAARSCRSAFFKEGLRTYSEICRKLDEKGLREIFTFNVNSINAEIAEENQADNLSSNGSES